MSAAAALALGSKALLPSLPALSALAAAAAASAATGGSSDGGGSSDIGGSSRSSRSSNSSSSSGAPSLLETAEGVALSDQVQAEAMLRAFGEDVALHTETALLQEEEGSTFFISDILKLVIAPFVAVLLDPIAGPAMRKGSDMLSGSGAAGPVAGIIAKIIGAIIAVPVAICCLIAIGCGVYVCYKRRKSRVPSGYGRPVTGAALPASAYGGKSDSRLIVGQTAASKI